MKEMFIRENFSREKVEGLYRASGCDREKTFDKLLGIVKNGGEDTYKVVG